ncbi:nitroreductase family protein [Anaerosporobacter sp.]|uniref:nitroreductase family protein n=1 Tax=Anaerosporobacter sp. TaxID=1872529 RepID=UPI00286F9C7F|nr:nitroreductase family protein [Anaerosporobacter sp.]
MEFKQVITERETVRKFDGKKPSEEQLKSVLEAGRIAPTAANCQPQRVYVLESEDALKKMDEAHPCRYNASTVLMVCADKSVALDLNGASSYEVDASIVATHMLLSAYNEGVDSVWLGVFEPEKVQKIFEVPKNILPVGVIDLGFRTEDYEGNPMHSKKNSMETMITRM